MKALLKIIVITSIVSLFWTGCATTKNGEEAMTAELPNFDKLWNYQKPDETEKKFRELLKKAESSGDTGYHAQLLTQIARTEGLQSRFDDAHATLDTVEKMLPKTDMGQTKIRYLLERGRVFNSSKQPEKAQPLFLEAWELGLEKNEDFYAVDAAHMLGIVEKGSKSLDWNEKAMDLAERSGDKRAKNWLGSLYNNIGWTYFDMKEYDTALKLFQKCEGWYNERNKAYWARVARWSQAKAIRLSGKTEQALEMQKTIMQDIEKNNEKQDGYVFEELGECYLTLGKKSEAAPWFKKAYDLLSRDSWIVKNEPEHLERLLKLSGEDK